MDAVKQVVTIIAYIANAFGGISRGFIFGQPFSNGTIRTDAAYVTNNPSTPHKARKAKRL
jgi:hypothetical protein